jgi:hypothetical protein
MKGRLFRVTMLVIVAMLLLASAVPAVGAEEITLTISNPQPWGEGGVSFDFVDTLGKITFANARLAVWDRQDSASFQTLADWGASWTVTLNEDGSKRGTIYAPGVLSDHCNRPGDMAIFLKLRVVVKPARTTTRLTWMATCP